ncbi:MAG: hypothetical protein JNL09_09730 [Anaerolineales bacterium]|nr:hypothetical protein [Anaerolineales bacterium]
MNATLPVTSTWQIEYVGPTGDVPSPITDIPSVARTYTLTGLTNYTLYTVTLSATTENAVISQTVQARPTDRFVFLPHIRR